MAAVRRISIQDLVALSNEGNLPDGHSPLGVAKLLARESVEASGLPRVEVSLNSIDILALKAEAEAEEGSATSAVPTWIEVIPAPLPGSDIVETRDWRAGFKVDAQEIVDAFNGEPAERRAKPIDYEHKGHRNWMSDRNPAAGWMEKLRVGDDGASVWAKTDWTDIGHDDLANKRYRYFSPVLAIEWPRDTEGKIDWEGVPKATRLIDGALTNNPATYIRDIARTPTGESDEDEMENSAGASALAASVAPPRGSTGGRTEDEDDDMKFSKEVLATLGLGPDATEEQINHALLDRLAKPDTAPAAAPQPAQQHAQQSAPTADMEALFKRVLADAIAPIQAKVEQFEASKQEDASKILDTQLHSIIESGIAAFKVTPASRDDLLEMGRAVGPDKLRAYVDKLPSQAHLSQPVGAGQRGAAPQRDEKTLSQAELSIAGKVGLSPDEMRKAKQTLREDGGRFKHGVSLMRRPKDDSEDEAAA